MGFWGFGVLCARAVRGFVLRLSRVGGVVVVFVGACLLFARSVGRWSRSLVSPRLARVVSLVLGGFLWPFLGAGAVRDARLFILRIPL